MTVAVLEVLTGNSVARTELSGTPFVPQTFSPNGRWLVTLIAPPPSAATMFAPLPGRDVSPTDTRLNLQSFPTADTKLEITGPSTPTAYALDPVGQLLAVGYQDGSITLWDIPGNKEILHAGFCRQAISQLAFTPDGNSLALTDAKSPIQRLDLTRLRAHLAEIGLDW